MSQTTSASSGSPLNDIRARITAAIPPERPQAQPELLAVSKTKPVEAIQALLSEGQRHFAENRVQEAQSKFPALKASYPDLVLHLIGPLQTNKVKEAVALFDAIHSLDREKLARALKAEMDRQDRHLPCFIQINTGQEPQKAGIAPDQTADFLKLCRSLGLNIVGLMCIPPFDEGPAPHFALLRVLAERNGLSQLSMGMSSDFEAAVQLGATHVRVGSALFGARD